MITTRTAIVGVAVLIGSSFIGENASATSYQHIDGMASRIQNNSALLNQEFRLHYAHAPGYLQLLSNSKYVFLRAQHIHVLAHHRGSVYQMANDLRVLDCSFHNLEQLLHKIELLVNQGQFGHIQGRTAHVHMLMGRILSDIHHLRADIESMIRTYRHSHVVYYPQQIRTVKKKPVQNYGEIRSGWTRTLTSISGGSGRNSDGQRNRNSERDRSRNGSGDNNRRSLSSR